MTQKEIDVMWQFALRESIKHGEVVTRYRFAEMVAAKELEAHKAAQVENEKLKEMLAKSGMETRRAVLEEREACAKVVEEYDTNWDAMHDLYKTLASNIRSRNYQ